MQDMLALAVVALAVGWLVRVMLKRLLAPPCGSQALGDRDGFVPLEDLTGIQKPGRP